MMGGALKSLILLVLRAGLGGVFIFAGVNKLEDPQAFANAIKAYDILPDHLTIVGAFAFPWLEIIAGGFLVLGLWSRASSLTILALLGGFLFAILSVIFGDAEVSECSCFGKAWAICKGAPGWCHVGQNSVLVLVGLVTLIFGGGAVSLDRAIDGPPKTSDGAGNAGA